MMKFFSLLTITFLLIIPRTAMADDGKVNFDKNWWNSLSDSQQIGVIEGIENGFQFGYMNGWIEGGANVEKMNWKLTSFSHTFGYYQAGITDYYVNHPNATQYSPASIMQCLSDEPMHLCKSMGF